MATGLYSTDPEEVLRFLEQRELNKPMSLETIRQIEMVKLAQRRDNEGYLHHTRCNCGKCSSLGESRFVDGH